MIREPKILIWDIETSLSYFSAFSCGDQVLRHGDLLDGYFSRTHIMTISYKWLGEKEEHVLDWGSSEADEAEMLRKFDEIIQQADLVIGKNSHRFDNKHLNTQRLFFDLPSMGDWMAKSEDLEQMLCKNFNVQSQSLDYWSKQLGIGGKIKMSKDSHWTPLAQGRALQLVLSRSNVEGVEALDAISSVFFGTTASSIFKAYEKALKEMKKYNKKDVADTAKVLQKVLPHVKLKFNYGAFISGQYEDELPRCRQCASENIAPRGNPRILVSGNRRQEYKCLDCKGFAGSVALPTIKGALG